ncbi:type II toxin-antitoxin system RelE/ParE family toxin [Holdemanella biformis]|uniref:type II toxin-antitoxin system RelE/ParE family toxin n=1 Tax=Holdemanella biformis TaxID=1735 RepID=UPI0029427877|nr:type II toxin-antitoxin system RelE/ParE family toxin [Holdemanella biformis]
MSYQLHITSTAKHDIMRAVDYMEFILKNPQAADNLLDTVTKQIETLSEFP